MTDQKQKFVTVRYWVGTLEHEGRATTYAGAKRIAARTRNATAPTYYAADGRRLYDLGVCLVPAGSDAADGNPVAYL